MPRLLSCALAGLALAGCQTDAKRDPLPYSPNYHVAGVARGGVGVVRKGYDGAGVAGTAQIVPDACVTPDIAADPLYLPPGCANNLNLQLMAERKSDLLRGRQTGPAMAAPVVRAARGVIDGTASAERAGAEDEVDTTGSGG
jgi:hypothetical protein